MPKTKRLTEQQQMIALLQHLLVLELWRSGLSQNEIRARLGMGIHAVNDMLKGVSRVSATRKGNGG